MNEEELKALVGDKAFEAMSAEQRAAAISKFTPPKEKDDDKDKDKNKSKGGKSSKTEDEEDDSEEGDKGDLREKIRKEKEAKESKDGEIKGIEKALAFNMGVESFVKSNVDILPSAMADLLKAAEKEKYDSAAEKASSIKKAFIEEFFAVQSNVDLLTANQKAQLDDFLKLTKNGKEQKAAAVYENLFEPALETLKKVKKAEELGKARQGFASSSKVEDGYKARLMAGSRKMYLNEKEQK